MLNYISVVTHFHCANQAGVNYVSDENNYKINNAELHQCPHTHVHCANKVGV